MQQISFNLDKYKQKKKATSHEFQNRGLEICEWLEAPANKKSQILRAVRDQRNKVESIISYMKGRGINSVFYFFKVFNSK